MDPDFTPLVQCQKQFSIELEKLRQESLGAPIVVIAPSEDNVDDAENEIDKRLDDKLGRAFPTESEEKIRKRRRNHIRTYLHSENALEALKVEHPILWEKAMRTLSVEEARLELLGSSAMVAHEVLKQSSDRLEEKLGHELANLESEPITRIVLGRLSDWLIRCPLDFPEAS